MITIKLIKCCSLLHASKMYSLYCFNKIIFNKKYCVSKDGTMPLNWLLHKYINTHIILVSLMMIMMIINDYIIQYYLNKIKYKEYCVAVVFCNFCFCLCFQRSEIWYCNCKYYRMLMNYSEVPFNSNIVCVIEVDNVFFLVIVLLS